MNRSKREGKLIGLIAASALAAAMMTVPVMAQTENEPYIIAELEGSFQEAAVVPVGPEIQRYIYEKCIAATEYADDYYCFILAVMQQESSFRASAYHENKNGTVDRGIMQINSSNIKKMKAAGLITNAEELYDPYFCIDCGMYLMNQYIAKFGITESAYFAYNTGRMSGGSNRNSRRVMSYMAAWKELLYGGMNER